MFSPAAIRLNAAARWVAIPVIAVILVLAHVAIP